MLPSSLSRRSSALFRRFLHFPSPAPAIRGAHAVSAPSGTGHQHRRFDRLEPSKETQEPTAHVTSTSKSPLMTEPPSGCSPNCQHVIRSQTDLLKEINRLLRAGRVVPALDVFKAFVNTPARAGCPPNPQLYEWVLKTFAELRRRPNFQPSAFSLATAWTRDGVGAKPTFLGEWTFEANASDSDATLTVTKTTPALSIEEGARSTVEDNADIQDLVGPPHPVVAAHDLASCVTELWDMLREAGYKPSSRATNFVLSVIGPLITPDGLVGASQKALEASEEQVSEHLLATIVVLLGRAGRAGMAEKLVMDWSMQTSSSHSGESAKLSLSTDEVQPSDNGGVAATPKRIPSDICTALIRAYSVSGDLASARRWLFKWRSWYILSVNKGSWMIPPQELSTRQRCAPYLTVIAAFDALGSARSSARQIYEVLGLLEKDRVLPTLELLNLVLDFEVRRHRFDSAEKIFNRMMCMGSKQSAADRFTRRTARKRGWKGRGNPGDGIAALMPDAYTFATLFRMHELRGRRPYRKHELRDTTAGSPPTHAPSSSSGGPATEPGSSAPASWVPDISTPRSVLRLLLSTVPPPSMVFTHRARTKLAPSRSPLNTSVINASLSAFLAQDDFAGALFALTLFERLRWPGVRFDEGTHFAVVEGVVEAWGRKAEREFDADEALADDAAIVEGNRSRGRPFRSATDRRRELRTAVAKRTEEVAQGKLELLLAILDSRQSRRRRTAGENVTTERGFPDRSPTPGFRRGSAAATFLSSRGEDGTLQDKLRAEVLADVRNTSYMFSLLERLALRQLQIPPDPRDGDVDVGGAGRAQRNLVMEQVAKQVLPPEWQEWWWTGDDAAGARWSA